MIAERLDILRYWIAERESIRMKKEADLPKPWTDDAILRKFRFCNVHREDDKVTRWIAANWRRPNDGHANMVLAMTMARMVNWPDTLEHLGFPYDWAGYDRQRFVDVMALRRDQGRKSWTGAYMITAEHNGTSKEQSVAKTLDYINNHEWNYKTCIDMWEALQHAPRVGSFIAAQIVADLKHTVALVSAPDYMTFCAPGPGSMAGLNWLLGYNLTESWNQAPFSDAVNELRQAIRPVEEMDAQDMQNCLCEVFKYQRGSSRSHYQGE